MAGIGFELKKLYKNRGIFFKLRALFYTAFVITGPQILFLLTILVFQAFISFVHLTSSQKDLFLASTIYALIFSQIITSGFSMIITRYVSNKLYSEEYHKILPSLYGVISICLPIGAIIGAVFLYRSPIGFLIKLSTYILFMELIIMWLQTVYLNALKDYIKIVKDFFIGLLAAVILAFILLITTKLDPILALLFSFDMGIFIIITLLMFNIQNFFESTDKKYFEFLKYFDKYSVLFFICLFYTLSLYIHNFIFWNGDLGRVIANTYLFAEAYDVPSFYAFLSILPTSIMFPIFVETAFYNRYKKYYSEITLDGNLKDIVRSRKAMTTTLWQELIHIMEIQLIFTIAAAVIGYYFLPYIGLTRSSINIFNILTLGTYCSIFMFIIVLIQLYFENRKGAFIIVSTFLSTNILFTFITLKLNPTYYGLGYFLSSFVSLTIGMLNLAYLLNNIDYITFCSQPIVNTEKSGFFSALVNRLYSK